MGTRDMRGGNYAAELQSPKVYRKRRKRLADAVGRGTVVLWGAGDDRGYGDADPIAVEHADADGIADAQRDALSRCRVCQRSVDHGRCA